MARLPLLLVAAAALAGCDSTAAPPTPSSLAGTYPLVAVDGAALPSAGITSGRLRLRIDQTMPVYDVDWTVDGTLEARSGLFSVSGSAIAFTQASGAGGSYVGQVDGGRVRVAFSTPTLTFDRDR